MIPAPYVDAAKDAIVHQAFECEKSLRLAAFADGERVLPSGIGQGMRKMAVYHSECAFNWAASLARKGGAQ